MPPTNSWSLALSRLRIHPSVVAAVGLLAITPAAGLRGQTNITYTRTSTGGLWNATGNWTPANTPNTATERAIFGNNSASNWTVDFNANLTVGGILFNSTAGSYIVSRNTTNNQTLTLSSATLSWSGIQSDSSSNQIVGGPNLRITLGNATVFRVGGTGNLSITAAAGNITTTGTNVITLNGTGGVGNVGQGFITSTINGTGTVTKSDAGTWTLSGANAYTGNTTITGGILIVGSNTALGTGNILFNGGALQASGTRSLANNATLTANSTISGGNNITLGTVGSNLTSNGSFTLTVNNTADTTIAGAVNLSNDTTSKTLTLNGTGNVIVTGVISNGSSTTGSNLVYSGTGNLTLTANNTYTGTTTINSGTVQVGNGTTSGSMGTGAITDNGNIVFNRSNDYTVSNAISGTGNVTQAGSGNLTLGGANSYQGNTTISSGTLTAGTDSAFGTSNLILNGGTLAANATRTLLNNVTLAANSTIGGSNVITLGNGTRSFTNTGNLTLTVNNAANTTIAGPVNLSNDATNKTLTLNGTGNLTISGAVANGGTSTASNLTYSGSGALTLNGTNTYSGTTTLSSGTLNINSAGALGSSTFTIAGGTIDNTSGAPVTLSANNAQNWNGNFTFGGTNNLNLGTGAVTLGGNRQVTTNGSGNLTVGGAIGGSGYSLTKAGSGNLILGGTNTYNGGTTLSAGNLTVNSGATLAASTGNLTVNGGTLYLNNAAQTVGVLSGSGGTIALANNHVFTANATTNGTYAGLFTGAANTTITKEGSNTLTLSGASSGFTGAVLVNNGTLALSNSNAIGGGSASTTVASGAALQMQGGITVSKGTLNLAGTGVSGSGALFDGSGNNYWSGNIALTANATVKTNSSGYFALGTQPPSIGRPPVDPSTIALDVNTLTLAGGTGSSNFYLNGRITGTGGLTVDMNNAADAVWLTANLNTYTGTTLIKQGTLVPYTVPNTYPGDNSADGGTDQYYGINGPITIGDGTGAGNSAILDIKGGVGTRTQELIDYRAPITINQDGLFSVGSSQTIGNLTFNGGNITISSGGTLYLNGNVTVDGTNPAIIDGVGNTLSLSIHKGALTPPELLPNADRAFDITNSGGSLTINAKIMDGSITKNGAGTMTITGNNTSGYEGTTTINNGILAITNNGSLGMGLNNNASATIVNSGANSGTLQLSNGITVSNEWLKLNGNGYGGNGALQNLSGSNTWAGSVILQNNTRIQSQAGTLTISGAISSTNNSTLEVRGNGDTTISGSIGTGNGGLTKNDGGTLTLSGNNNYAGATTINAGVVSLQSASGLGSTTANTTVAGGAELQLNNTAIGGGSNVLSTDAEPLTISGTGVTGQGALRSVAGPNVFAGQVTIDSGGATISANTGHSLNLSGGTTGSNTLTVGTATSTGLVTISGNMSNGSGGLIKNGTGNLTIASASTQSATVGQVQLLGGNMTVGGGGANTTLNATDFDSNSSATLIIASGGTVSVTQAAGTQSTFGGTIGSASVGEFKFTGTTNLVTPENSSTLAFTQSFTATDLTLTLNGGRLLLSGVHISVGTIHITANTILDFDGTANTWLTSSALVIDAGVTVTVNNWFSLADNAAGSTVWYANSTINSGTLGGSDLVGGVPLANITFTNYGGMTTTWVSGNHNGWFNHEIRPTPEPATYGALLLSACLGLLGWRRWRKQKPA